MKQYNSSIVRNANLSNIYQVKEIEESSNIARSSDSLRNGIQDVLSLTSTNNRHDTGFYNSQIVSSVCNLSLILDTTSML